MGEKAIMSIDFKDGKIVKEKVQGHLKDISWTRRVSGDTMEGLRLHPGSLTWTVELKHRGISELVGISLR